MMNHSADMEHRAIAEFRAQGRRLEGYAAKFGADAHIGAFVETIAPGAFTASLASRPDILALADHDSKSVLGRTRSGTLRLSEDSKGLAFSLDLPDTRAGRDILTLAERGDLGGMSFGFTVPADGDHWQAHRRELRNVVLHEISVVSAWPAYDGTEVALRSIGRSLVRHRARALSLMKMGVHRWV